MRVIWIGYVWRSEGKWKDNKMLIKKMMDRQNTGKLKVTESKKPRSCKRQKKNGDNGLMGSWA